MKMLRGQDSSFTKRTIMNKKFMIIFVFGCMISATMSGYSCVNISVLKPFAKPSTRFISVLPKTGLLTCLLRCIERASCQSIGFDFEKFLCHTNVDEAHDNWIENTSYVSYNKRDFKKVVNTGWHTCQQNEKRFYTINHGDVCISTVAAPASNISFRIVTNPGKDHQNAEKFCQSVYGSSLFTPRSYELIMLLYEKLSQKEFIRSSFFWINGKYDNSSKRWLTSNYEEIPRNNLTMKLRKNRSQIKCAAMGGTSPNLKARECHKTADGFICK